MSAEIDPPTPLEALAAARVAVALADSDWVQAVRRNDGCAAQKARGRFVAAQAALLVAREAADV